MSITNIITTNKQKIDVTVSFKMTHTTQTTHRGDSLKNRTRRNRLDRVFSESLRSARYLKRFETVSMRLEFRANLEDRTCLILWMRLEVF